MREEHAPAIRGLPTQRRPDRFPRMPRVPLWLRILPAALLLADALYAAEALLTPGQNRVAERHLPSRIRASARLELARGNPAQCGDGGWGCRAGGLSRKPALRPSTYGAGGVGYTR
jgi:hypothetical protein